MRLVKNSSKYVNWLLTLITPQGEKPKTQDPFLRSLHNDYIFTHFVPNDSNRAAQGVELRSLFEYETGVTEMVELRETTDPEPCSLLEMMVGLAKTLSENFGSGDMDDIPAFFWEMMRNLNFRAFNPDRNDYIIQNFLSRTYSHDGTGGMFPLKNPKEDQRRVELWYQAQAYYDENPLP